MKFTYRWGQRPLEGYTIKRGLGHGGFGEVYFAVSDGGKEVALKLIRGHTDIELRGVTNCLNLKYPNLVHLYDLKVDAQGDRWLVMEYVQGEPLSAILNRNPHGLPEAQVRDWFLQAARAVAFLHDHAVVHRDIKPANLFIENGIVKLGDYGLSKSVSTSQHSQSSNVGTIYYMAPEVASGAYSKQIDIYACGVMLYEMLTGEVPFKGDSWAEVAIKHQTDLPDMGKAPIAYISILEKALNKKAERRYANMNEMIQAVELLGNATRPTPQYASPPQANAQAATRPAKPIVSGDVKPTRIGSLSRGKLSELATSMFMTPVFALPATAIWALFTGSVRWAELETLYLIMIAVVWAVLLTSKVWDGRDGKKPRRLALGVLGCLIGLAAFWLNGWALPETIVHDESTPPGLDSYWGGLLRMEPGGMETLTEYVIFFALALMVPRWWMAVDRKRKERFTLYPLLASGLWSLILLGVLEGMVMPHNYAPPGYLVLAMAGAAAVMQLVSPWRPAPPVTMRFRRRWPNFGAAR